MPALPFRNVPRSQYAVTNVKFLETLFRITFWCRRRCSDISDTKDEIITLWNKMIQKSLIAFFLCAYYRALFEQIKC